MRIFATIAFLLASAFPAFAAEPNWTGCYVGGHVGYSSATTEADLNTPLAPVGVNFDGLGASGANFGALAGCDLRIAGSPFVVGAFADFTRQDLEHEITLTVGVPVASVRYSIEDSYSIGGRLGYLVNPTTLAYALAAHTWAQTSPLTVAGASFGTSDLTGWTIGGGIETQIAANLMVRVEYRQTWFEDDRVELVPGFLNLDLDTTEHVGRVGLTYRFGM